MRLVPCRPAPDPLAVWAYVEAGEEIPCGDPSVTDEERAAAGRETVAARSRALLQENRRRAAEQHATGGLPDGHDVVRVWWPRDPATLRARLRDAPLAVWAEADILQVLWRGQADELELVAGVQPRMWPVEGTDDLWEASLRIRRLDQAVISITVWPSRADDELAGQASDTLVWRGPRAPAAPPAAGALTGAVEEHTLHSPLPFPASATGSLPSSSSTRFWTSWGCRRPRSAAAPWVGPGPCGMPSLAPNAFVGSCCSRRPRSCPVPVARHRCE